MKGYSPATPPHKHHISSQIYETFPEFHVPLNSTIEGEYTVN